MAKIIALACSAALPTIGSKITLMKATGMFQATDAPCEIQQLFKQRCLADASTIIRRQKRDHTRTHALQGLHNHQSKILSGNQYSGNLRTYIF